MLKASGLKVIKQLPGAKCVYHIYLIELSNRDEVMNHFKEKGIQCGIHYPIPLPQQPALKYLGHKKGDFPVTERCSERILSLPMYAEMTSEMQDVVVKELLRVAKV
jgi:dTDP-4-amino-4,6-dideoxygalactose transaminase